MHSNQIKFFDIDLKYKKNQKNIDKNILRNIKSGQFILGDELKKLEKSISNLSQTKYCVGTSSGTDSLLVALLAIGIKKGAEIITSSFSWLSVIETILLLGAKPVYLDINLNVSP